jgi:hypothetical protein
VNTERNGSLGDITLNEVWRGLRRYQPFILTVIAVVLVAWLLPGKPAPTNGTLTNGQSTTDTGASGNGVSGSGTQAAGSGSSASSITGGHGAASGSASGPTQTINGVTYTLSSTVDKFCDKATGRLMFPTLYAPPCMPAFSGTGNGGSTYNGVTKDTITVAIPYNASSAATTAALAQDPDTHSQIQQTQKDYNTLFQHHFQTYGRNVKLVEYNSSYNSGDSAAAKDAECQSDANKVTFQIKAFVSYGDCGTNAYENTLVKNGVLCFCTVTIPASFYLNWAPYVWGTGLPDEEAAYLMRAEMICEEINPYPPKFAGDKSLDAPLTKKRSFGLVWPGPSPLDNTTVYEPGAKYFEGLLKSCGANLVSSDSMPIIDTGPSTANGIMARYKKDKITDVIVVQDPIDPKWLTAAATSNNYFPEWIVTGSALTDETFFARQYDQEQWKNAFGLGLLADRVAQNLSDAYNTYNWQFHKTPPAPNTYNLIYPFFYWFYTGVQLAGPNLNPQTFQCGEPPYTSHTLNGDKGSKTTKPCVGKTFPGLFGYPTSPSNFKQRVSNPLIFWGDRVWPWDSYNIIEDSALLYWDASATGPDEYGHSGAGEYRYMHGGKRYTWHELPKGDQPWFNSANTVTVFNTLPAADKPPAYPYKCYYLC